MSLFPTETNLGTDFDPIVLGKALKFVTLAVERNTAVALEVDTDHITLTGGGEHSDSRMSDTVPADVYGRDVGLGLEVGFNPDFLADVLKVFGKNRVTMRTVNNAKPGLFTSDAVPGFRVLLMPRKLRKES